MNWTTFMQTPEVRDFLQWGFRNNRSPKRRTSPAKRDNSDLRDRKSDRYTPQVKVPQRFRRFAEESILNHLTITRTHVQDKRNTLTGMLLQLIRSSLHDRVIADSRDTGIPGVKPRVKLWDALENARFVRKCLGSELAEKVTRYAATTKLLTMQDCWTPIVFPERPLRRNSSRRSPTRHALVVVQSRVPSPTGKKMRVARPFEDFPADLAFLCEMEDRIKKLNDRNRRHKWTLVSSDGGRFEPGFLLRQIHIDRPWNGTRLYSAGRYSIQNLRKETRQRLLIDGQATCEPDFSGSIPRLLYHCTGHPGPADSADNDIYQIDRIFPDLQTDVTTREKLRTAVKLATIVCINCDSIHAALGAVWEKLKSKKLWSLVQTWLGGPSNPAEVLVARICDAHPLVTHLFFSNQGLQLMTIEGRIMLEILERITATGRPALGIHDAVLCRRQDEEFVKSVMTSVYRSRTGFDPVVK